VNKVAREQKQNKSVRSFAKTCLSKAEELIAKREMEAAKEAVVKAVSALDRAARKEVIHPNKAARHKSRLMKKLNQALKSEPVAAPSKPPRRRRKAAGSTKTSEPAQQQQTPVEGEISPSP
jgi:small subunit ribosomal protein S20